MSSSRKNKCLNFFRTLPVTTPTINRQRKWCSALEVGLYISAETALLIVTAWCLWHPREEDPALNSVPPGVDLRHVCNLAYQKVEYAPGKHMAKFPTSCDEYVNVVSRFTQTLRCWFAYFVIQWVRMLLYLVTLCLSDSQVAGGSRFKRGLNWLLDFSTVPLFLYWIAILVMLHVYRFAPSGKFASFDYFSHSEHSELHDRYFDAWDATDVMPESGQYIRGQYLLGLVVYIWVVQVFLFHFILRSACACCICFNKCTNKDAEGTAANAK
jgi:hypothetical protein